MKARISLLPITLFIVSIILNTSPVTAQSEHPMWIGASTGFNFNYRHLFNANHEQANDAIIGTRNEREEISVLFAAGIHLRCELKEAFILNTGFNFTQMGYNTPIDLRFEDQIDASRGFMNSNGEPISGLPLVFKDKFNYLELPVSLDYQIPMKYTHFFAGLGVIPGWLLSANKVLLVSSDSRPDRLKQEVSELYRKFNISPQARIGFNYSFNDKLLLTSEMHFQYGVLSIIDTPVGGHLWNVGTSLAFYYHL